MKVNFQVRCEGLSNKAQRDSWVTYKKGLHKMEGKNIVNGLRRVWTQIFFFPVVTKILYMSLDIKQQYIYHISNIYRKFTFAVCQSNIDRISSICKKTTTHATLIQTVPAQKYPTAQQVDRAVSQQW